MEDAVAAILAAVISAAVVAGTFVTAEVLRTLQAARRERVEAVLALLAALDQLPLQAAKSLATVWPFRRSLVPPDLEIAAASIRLFAYLPKRDWVVARWVGWRLAGLDTTDVYGRVSIGAELSGVLIGYLSNPRRARRFTNRSRREILEWTKGRNEPDPDASPADT